MDRWEVRRRCQDHGLSDFVDQLLGESHTSAAWLRLVPTAPDAIATGASRFGGQPDMPPGSPWPRTRSRRFLTFLAQINLAECAHCFAEDPTWPRDGHLVFFYDAGTTFGYEFEDFDRFQVLYWRPDQELAPRSRPQPIAGRDVDPSPLPMLPSARIEYVPRCSLPSPLEAYSPVMDLIRQDGDTARRYVALWNACCGVGERRPLHFLGGHVIEYQEGLLGKCVSRRRGIGPLPSGHPAGQDVRREAYRWRLLLQLDHDLTLPFEPMERLFFCASNACIEDRSFDSYWALTQAD